MTPSHKLVVIACKSPFTMTTSHSYYPKQRFYLCTVPYRNGVLGTVATMLIRSLTDFMSDMPYFTIIGKTTGGPPTHYRWYKDGQPLATNATFNITIAPMPQNMVFRYQDAMYESILTVIGREPGVYQFEAANRVSSMLVDTTSIEGNKLFFSNSIQVLHLGKH